MQTHAVFAQPSWRLATPEVEAFVTRRGGHLGPVTFACGGARVQPFHVAPWAQEQPDPDLPAMLQVLRGDFFCLPFGGNETPYHGETHPPHGETANACWNLESNTSQTDTSGERNTLHLSLATTERDGRVDKFITLVRGHSAVYSRHVVSGMSDTMSFGHHAMLRFPDFEGSGLVSTSPFAYGQVSPQPLETSESGGRSCLMPGAAFTDLREVSTMTGEVADLSRYPARRGFEDLVQLIAAPDDDFAWTAVSFPREGYVWFALKDPRVLTGTILWHSNGGRDAAPWSGRHLNVLGLEEVTSYFHYGLAQSASANPLSERGFATATQLSPERALTVNTIIAVAPIAPDFGAVKSIERVNKGVLLTSESGQSAETPLDVGFLSEQSNPSKGKFTS